jgi:pseudouridine synthase
MNDKTVLRLNVYLAQCGIASRRKAMTLVQSGRVSVNGNICREPSTAIVPGKDLLSLDGKSISATAFVYIILHKPKGVTTTRYDRHAEHTVLDLLPAHLRHLHPVGRLDKESEGLLLMTNDGDLTFRLTHPRFHVDKTYEVTVRGCLTQDEQRRLEQGIFLGGKKTQPAKLEKVIRSTQTTHFWITIHEGRKRQIRHMLQVVHHPVVQLKRIRIGLLELGRLLPGTFRTLRPAELTWLNTQRQK